ncbi:MAG: dockerin type I repeat-containing protein [bacterium]|nr:dockerin type I repeat-containing protein [bacterium]
MAVLILSIITPLQIFALEAQSSVTVTAIVNSRSTTPPPPSGGGGGGGGGGGSPVETGTASITISGIAYPLSKVSVLKDGQLAVTTIAGPNALFSVTISNVSSGNHIFTVYGEDKNRVKSATFTIPVYVTANASTFVGGIFIPPTIDIDKAEVARGNIVTVLGQTKPKAEITVRVHSEHEIIQKVLSDDDGVWLYKIDTSGLEYGNHEVKARAVSGNDITEYSKIATFKVGTKDVVVDKNQACLGIKRGDVNCDGKVNLIDFSIVAFWYKKVNPPVNVDVNNDKKVDLIDFSILAYNWTG